MIGLLLKDLFNLKKYVKQISVSILIIGLVAIYLKNPAYLIGMIAMMSSMMVITSMSYDELAKWDKYALTMPVLRKDMVLSKYLLLLITILMGTVASGVIAFIMSAVMKLQSLKEIILVCGIIALIMLLLFGILIPILIKYGVEKARIIMFAVFAVPVFAAVGFAKLMVKLKVPMPSIEQVKLLGYAFPVIVLIILFLSYHISVIIYNKKEF